MNRKDKTVKQLQAECKKRRVGYMGNWTKTALIKRLEDEDKRDIDIKKLKDEINKAYNDPKAATLIGNRVKLDAMDRATFGSVRDNLWYLGGEPEDPDENQYAKDWLSRGRKNNKKGGKIKKNYSKGGGVRSAKY